MPRQPIVVATEALRPLALIVADNARAYRVLQRWTQATLADRVCAHGIAWTRATVSDAENGLRNITVGELDALARAFGVEVIALLDAAGPGRLRVTCHEQADQPQRCLIEPHRRRQRLTDALLREVVEVHRAAAERGEPQRLAVADHFGEKPDTVSKWITEARRRGLFGGHLALGG